RRRVKSAVDNMNRLYVVENRFSLTGAMADHRLRCPASQVAAFAHALAQKILGATNDSGLGALVGAVQNSGAAAAFDERWLAEAASDLLAKPGASLVLAGPSQPVPVQMLVYGINAALKNLGQTLVLRRLPHNPRTIAMSQLASDINDGHVKRLFILGGDPVYNAKSGVGQDRQTNLPNDWGVLQKKGPGGVRLGYYSGGTFPLRQWEIA